MGSGGGGGGRKSRSKGGGGGGDVDKAAQKKYEVDVDRLERQIIDMQNSNASQKKIDTIEPKLLKAQKKLWDSYNDTQQYTYQWRFPRSFKLRNP